MYKAALASFFVLVSCQEQEKIKQGYDQCLRREIFKECLSLIPKGPEVIGVSNDWDEVIETCSRTAGYQSLRNLELIKPECRLE